MIKYCEWCDDSFDTKNKNQIYCNPKCRALATKKKIAQRYKLNKSKEKMGKTKKCAGGCTTMISVYSDSKFCDVCLVDIKKTEKFIKDLRNLFNYEQK
jgi:hypothetical protein